MKASQRLDKARASHAKAYGNDYVNLGGHHYRLNVQSTGSLMFDYKTGIGGVPYGHAVEVFGANKLGKSSAIGYITLGNVIRANKLPVVIASEPRLVTPGDKEWALKLGFDPDQALILYPDNAQEAFDMLRGLVFSAPSERPDYIMIDSLGGLGNKSSAVPGGTTKAYGISGDTTSALNDIMPRLYKNNIGLMIVNQQRQSGSYNGNTMYDSPGGEALHHHMRMRVQVKPGVKRYTIKLDGESVMVGRELICKFVKNNLSQGQEKSAAFEFFHIETEQYGFGINTGQDIINVGKMTGVLQGGTWLEHPSFPETKSGEHKLQGKNAVAEYLHENPKAYVQVREEVMAVMIKRELEAAAAEREESESEVTMEVEDE